MGTKAVGSENFCNIFSIPLVSYSFGKIWKLLFQFEKLLYQIASKINELFSYCYKGKLYSSIYSSIQLNKSTLSDDIMEIDKSDFDEFGKSCDLKYNFYKRVSPEEFERYLTIISLFEVCDSCLVDDIDFFDQMDVIQFKCKYSNIIPLFCEGVTRIDPAKEGPRDLEIIKNMVWEAFGQFELKTDLHETFPLFHSSLHAQNKKVTLDDIFSKNRPYFTVLLIEAYFKALT